MDFIGLKYVTIFDAWDSHKKIQLTEKYYYPMVVNIQTPKLLQLTFLSYA